MKGPTALDLVVTFIVIATVYVLVRPKSKGTELVQAIGQALTAIVSNAADLAGG